MNYPSLARPVALVLLAGLLAPTLDAQRGGGRGGRNQMPEPKGNYVVAQVGQKVAIIRKSQVAWFKQRLGQQYLEEQRQWKLAKKEATRNRVKIDLPKPEKKKLKVVNASSKTEAKARKVLDTLIAKSQKQKNPQNHLEEAELIQQGRRRGGRGAGGPGAAGAGGKGRAGGKKDATGKGRRGAKKGDAKKDKKDG